ncbi:Hemerythrin HHE cation binding domain protein [Kribbella flavida DSM 17836]|uniref:Hemerythrin HHE cation binding domain protein n=1 Tax=Kribbella flavida (strain DSM 17836 / JCM 10339 / NBRC 14399) TaxID=479435 RepID=D2PLL0_KRIFD|nr:hemerythrin domain-containing protein [Kribbella flavida]ADB30639.1 Hemerythrin HHE cation binding domain protein [Kribbella flavida DSM 17836]
MAGDVVDLIMQDHREVERLFDELKDNPETRRNLVPVLTTLLTAHSRAEEAEVYPAAASEAGEADDVAHSQEEHVEADELLEKLAGTDPESAQFDKVLQDLIDAVTHHVEEEESKVLPGLRANLSAERLAELADAFATSREKHLGEQPTDITREQLQQQARNADVSGTSGLGKDALQSKLREEASE